MSEIAIRVDNLSKMYRIGGPRVRYKRFTESMMDALTAPVRRLQSLGKPVPEAETIWALKDISFEVKRGDVVGVIGRNGAGKSTLLKVLSRITEPTEGYAEIHGRVGSLLEVGTGFHPELTGRENIYLNGAILGMRRAEIAQKFDEIVTFAEVEKFIDTPVKRYSSGMYVRLAFAVAAHLEPEILVVDEVLAVGDLAFQKKCLGKMGEVAKGGRTVLFVSHNMGAIRRLCGKSIWLDYGKMKYFNDTESVVVAYQSSIVDLTDDTDGRFERDLSRDVPARLTWVGAIELRDTNGNLCHKFKYGQDLQLVLELGGDAVPPGFSLSWILYDSRGAPIGWSNSMITCGFYLDEGDRRAACTLKKLPLAVGRYSITVSGGIVGSGEPKDLWRDAAVFEVVECDPFDTKNEHRSEPFGAVIFDQKWEKI